MDHRTPPKPPFYDTAVLGQCRYCGLPILDKKGNPKKRANWHPDCVNQYKLIYWPNVTRRAVWARDKGKCAGCGTQCTRKGPQGWHMDHITPLIEAKGDVRYWQLPNLQTLCHTCHHAKTGAEATARAEARRKQKLDEASKSP